MENRLTQQFHDINNYKVDISVATEGDDHYIPETLFYKRTIVNKLGYVEHNLSAYLNKLLLKYNCCKTSGADIISWTTKPSPPSSPTITTVRTHKRVKYFPFLDDPKHILHRIVYNEPIILAEK